MLLVSFLRLEQRAARPLFPPHIWKLNSLVSGTAVMLGVTGILVGTVFLTSIFLQTVLGFSALAHRPGLPALRPGHHRRDRGRPPPAGPRVPAGHRDDRAAHHGGRGAPAVHGDQRRGSTPSDILPGLSALGLGVGMVFVPVSVTSMAGIPASHAGVASGFLMTGHEIGAALGVAVLSAVASTAGSLTTAAGAADAFSRGFVGAAVMGGVVAACTPCSGCPRPGRPAAAVTCTCTDVLPQGGARPFLRPGASASARQGTVRRITQLPMPLLRTNSKPARSKSARVPL